MLNVKSSELSAVSFVRDSYQKTRRIASADSEWFANCCFCLDKV